MSEKETMPYDANFQAATLKHMLLNEAFCIQCLSFLRPDWFEGKYAWAFQTIDKLYNEFDKVPALDELRNEVRKFPPKKQSEYSDVIKHVAADHSISLEYVRRELTGYARNVMFIKTFYDAQQLYNSGARDDAYIKTREWLDNIVQTNFTVDDIFNWGDVPTVLKEASEKARNAVPTGIIPLDEAMGGGLVKGTHTTLLSGQNAGKSMAAKNFAYHAIMNERKVLMTIHEDEKKKTIIQMLARMTGIPYNKLKANVLNSDEQKIVKRAQEMLNEFLVVKFMYGFDTSIEDIRDYCRVKKSEFDFELLIVDYAQLLQTKKPSEGLRFTQAIVFRGLVAIANELDIATMSPAQGNRDAQKKNTKGTEFLRSIDISEAFEIARVSSNIITLNRSEEDVRDNRLYYYLDKNREGQVNIAVECNTDFSRCITHDVNMGMKEVSTNPIHDLSLQIGQKGKQQSSQDDADPDKNLPVIA